MPSWKSQVTRTARRGLDVLPREVRALVGRGGTWLADECGQPTPTTDAHAEAVPRSALLPERPLPLPADLTEAQLRARFATWSIDGEPEGHMDAYVADSFGRFVHTYGMVAELSGSCLELGANPYFTTHLIQHYSDLDVSHANYFGNDDTTAVQRCSYRGDDGEVVTERIESKLFNIEDEEFPYPDAEFDVVMYCEILEHLLMDPVHVLAKIRRVLRPDGVLIVTTPNVARLNNMLRIAGGHNIYDPYSGYGPYGRHNREYTMTDLHALLSFMGFEIEQTFAADSHDESYESDPMYPALASHLTGRGDALGQYLFVRARIAGPARDGLPELLYRSYPPGTVVPTYATA